MAASIADPPPLSPTPRTRSGAGCSAREYPDEALRDHDVWRSRRPRDRALAPPGAQRHIPACAGASATAPPPDRLAMHCGAAHRQPAFTTASSVAWMAARKYGSSAASTARRQERVSVSEASRHADIVEMTCYNTRSRTDTTLCLGGIQKRPPYGDRFRLLLPRLQPSRTHRAAGTHRWISFTRSPLRKISTRSARPSRFTSVHTCNSSPR